MDGYSTPVLATNSPSAAAYQDFLEEQLAGDNERGIQEILTQLMRYGMLKFGMVAMNYPFETGRLLRQVQFGSYEASQEDREEEPEDEDEDEDENQSFINNDRGNGDETGMASRESDNNGIGRKIGEMYSSGGNHPQAHSQLPSEISRDGSGYLKTRPVSAMKCSQWPLLIDKHKTIWNTIGLVSRHQGIFALWRGVTVAWVQDILMDLSRATCEETLDASSLIQELHVPGISSTIEEEVLKPTLIAGFAQGIAGVLLSPFEMVRHRLAAQSVWPQERKYHGLWDTLKKISAEEVGGVFSLFRNPVLTFSSNLLKPVLRILPISLLNVYFGPSPDSSLFATTWWLLLQNTSACLSLLVTLPLETIRRRLLIQRNPSNLWEVPYITRVKTSPVPYASAWDAFWRILREEGIHAFYQGWGMEVAGQTASFMMAVLAEMAEEGSDDELEF